MTKEQKEYDSSKPLRNRKHEIFAREMAKNPTEPQEKAYLKAYPESSLEAAKPHASRLVSNGNVRERVMALMTEAGAGLKDVSRVVSKHLHGDNAPVSMDAAKTILKVSSALDEQRAETVSFNPIQINFIVHAPQSATPIIEADNG